MTISDINIDCGRARDKAGTLNQQASELRTISSNLQQTLSKLETSWQGQGSQTFVRRGSERAARLNQEADRLDEIANAIRKSADAYQKKEVARVKEELRKQS